MPRVIVFEDGHGQLAPLTGLRAAFDVRTGALTTLERVRLAFGSDAVLVVPEPLARLTRERHRLPVNEPPTGSEPVLVLNGRAPLAAELAAHLTPDAALIERTSGHLIAALVPASRVPGVLGAGGDRHGIHAVPVDGLNLMARPWHVRLLRDRCLAFDLQCLGAPKQTTTPTGVITFGSHRLTVGPDARVCPGATFDLEGGPIVMAEHAVVRPGAVVIGPAYIGPHSTVMDRAIIRAQTAIGPHCKVGGEVGGTIFQGYSNKAHDGYLGDSWVGEWVNLGAGTNNSNLLNTYGEVKARATPGGPLESTGDRFVGAFIGDHVKTAIGTRIMTGCVIHTGAMIASTAPASGCIPPFAWLTDAPASTWRLDQFLETARAMMARRQVEPSAAYLDRVRSLHTATG